MNITNSSDSKYDHNIQEITLTREQLYQKVWSIPAIKLAKELGISDVAITKICKKLNIPKPHPGYWKQVSTHKNIRIVPLPSIAPGISDEIIIYPQIRHQQAPFLNPDLREKIQFEQQPENRIGVETTLRSPHKFIQETRKVLSGTSPDRYNRLTGFRTIPSLDVHVSEASLNRALCIMNALIYALEFRGYTVTANTDRQYRTVVAIADNNVHVRIIEKVDRRKIIAPKISSYSPQWDYLPTGILQFEIAPYWSEGCQKRWSDSPTVPLENQLNDIIAGILICADAQHRRTKEMEVAHQRENEKRLAREELERQKQAELNRYKQLESQADVWQKSQSLRAFIKACEMKFIERLGTIQPDSPEAEWLHWANNYVDTMDPLLNNIVSKEEKL